jgi:hypothetical protein
MALWFIKFLLKNIQSGVRDALFGRTRLVDGRDKVSQKWSFKNEPPG